MVLQTPQQVSREENEKQRACGVKISIFLW